MAGLIEENDGNEQRIAAMRRGVPRRKYSIVRIVGLQTDLNDSVGVQTDLNDSVGVADRSERLGRVADRSERVGRVADRSERIFQLQTDLKLFFRRRQI